MLAFNSGRTLTRASSRARACWSIAPTISVRCDRRTSSPSMCAVRRDSWRRPQAAVESIVVISSLSAFAGCRSLYGKAKLQIESLALSADAVVIRPGLVYGNDSGGMFGRLVRQVRGSRLLPVLWA